MTSEDLIIVGKLGRFRGVHGDIWVTPETDFPERFDGLKKIFVQNRREWEEMALARTGFVSGRPVLKFVGVDSPEEAARMTNRLLAVPRDQAVELPEDMFYIFDLIGCEVFEDGSDELVGEIVNVEQYPGNDVYFVKTPAGTEMLFPATKEYIRSIDTDNRKVIVSGPGLIDGEKR